MIERKLFDTAEMRALLSEKSSLLLANRNSPKHNRLGEVLRIIAANATDFDRLCQLNIEWTAIGTNNRLHRLDQNTSDIDIEVLTALVFRFVIEFDISSKGDLLLELREFLDITKFEASSFDKSAKDLIENAQTSMPVAILKRILNSEHFGSLRNVPNVAAEVDRKIDSWNESLQKHEATASRLADILSQQSDAFNFVGLHDGFKDLSTKVRSELRFAQAGMFLFGCCIITPASVNLWLILGRVVDPTVMPNQSLAIAGIGSLTLTLLFLYFFRIALRKADSCRAQLLQLGLRMSMCRFIQRYADYSSEIRKNNPNALDKFESLIFSGLVESSDRLPTTFDGIDQLVNIAKAINSKE